MNELQDNLKIRLSKNFLKYVLKQYKSFELPKSPISTLDLIGKFDVEFLIQYMESKDESKRKGVLIEKKDNHSPTIAKAVEGTVLAKTIALTLKGKIEIHF